MHQLLPEPAEIDPAGAHAAAARPPHPDRPWVMLNMVTSLCGATAVDGVSGGLGAPADKIVFSAIRAVADIIVVAAGTARAESYGPPQTPPERQADRVARGQNPYPRLALVTRSLDLDPAATLFTEAPEKPLVFTVADAPAERRTALTGVAEVVTAGVHDVDLNEVLSDLYQRGARVVLVEGGPGLNGQLVAECVVDELNISLSPLLVGGHSARLAHGTPPPEPEAMVLAHLWEADGLLFGRYVRR